MKDWRDVVHAHLQAYREDVHTHQVSALSGAQAQFLKTFSVPSFQQAYDIDAKARCDALGQPPPKESYEVIEESAHRVLAQIRPSDRVVPNELRIPYLTVRILLIEDEAGWKTAGVYHPCLSCNARAMEDGTSRTASGRCIFCGGKGITHIPELQVRGFGLFKRRIVKTGPCGFCGGTGKCLKCAEGEMPGWRRVFSLGG
jgi:hypothetical protein